MDDCRCRVLNVMSGAVARDYASEHLQPQGTDGMGRRVYRCGVLGVEWVEERSASVYADEATVLRRAQR